VSGHRRLRVIGRQVADEPFPWTLREGAKGVQLAELSWESHRKGTWVDVPKLA
jgi:hypothetical protein